MKTQMPILQKVVHSGRRVFPRGWSPMLILGSSIYRPWRDYPASMNNGDVLYLDLHEKMCHDYFFMAGQTYEKGTEILLHQFLRPGDTFIDVGANIGYYTRMASKIVGHNGYVYAFEPMPSAFQLLQRNSDDLENVVIYQKAISNRIGEAAFSVREYGNLSSLGYDANAKQSITVAATTLDAALSNIGQVDFIKIDVEGYELNVLHGALNIFEKHRPIIYCEYLEDYANRYAFNLNNFSSIFHDIDYSIRWVNHRDPERKLFTEDITTYFVAIPNERMN